MNSRSWHRPGSPTAETTSTLNATQGSATLPPKSTASSPLHDRERHNIPHYAYGVCKIFTLCHVTDGSFEKNIETTGFNWFAEDDLPPLAVAKNREEQVRMCFEAYRAGDEWKVRFD